MVALLLSLLPKASAEERLPFAQLLEEVSESRPACFGREYSDAQLKTRPAQTVRLIRAKVSKQTGVEGAFLELEILQKDSTHRLWTQFFLCNTNGECAVECDGGSATLSLLTAAELQLDNHRFLLEGGCENSAQPTYLANTPGSDDVFVLARLPQQYCAP